MSFSQILDEITSKYRNVSLVHSDISNTDTISDLINIPIFEFHRPSACSPYVNCAEEEMLQWAIQYNLTSNDEHKARFKRVKYGWLVSRCYPVADYLMFRILVDYHSWIFLVHDFLVDHADACTGPHTIQN